MIAYVCKDCPEWARFEFEDEAFLRGRDHKYATQHSVALLDVSELQAVASSQVEEFRATLEGRLFGGPTDEPPNPAEFDGPAYDAEADSKRLTGQILRVWTAMSDGEWRTVNQISEMTHDPQPSVLAQLGHLRKEKFGAYLVERRKVNESGLFEYRVGAKGAGTPQHVHCLGCDERDAEIARLQHIIESERASSGLRI